MGQIWTCVNVRKSHRKEKFQWNANAKKNSNTVVSDIGKKTEKKTVCT